MSETLTVLRKQAKSLGEMLSEIDHADAGARISRDWRSGVAAAATIGGDTEIPYWALVEHFLLTWIAWFQVSRLYSVYFGHGPSAATMLPPIPGIPLPMFPGLPTSWAALHRLCQRVKDRVSHDGDLPEILASSWGFDRSNGPAISTQDVDELFVDLVESHERLRLLEVYANFGHPSWSELHRRVQARDKRLGRGLEEASAEVRDAVLTHLRFYRHATLDVSWMRGDWNPVPWDAPDSLSAVRRFAVAPVPDENWGARLTEELEAEPGLTEHLRALLSRIQRATWELGFECLAEDVTAKDFRPGTETPVGTPAVGLNLAPSRSSRTELKRPRGRLREGDRIVFFEPRAVVPQLPSLEPDRLLLYASKPSRGGWKRTSRTFEAVAGYLAEAPRRPDVVTILSATWDAKDFARRHRSALLPHARSGVKFLFLLAGEDRRLSKVEIGL